MFSELFIIPSRLAKSTIWHDTQLFSAHDLYPIKFKPHDGVAIDQVVDHIEIVLLCRVSYKPGYHDLDTLSNYSTRQNLHDVAQTFLLWLTHPYRINYLSTCASTWRLFCCIMSHVFILETPLMRFLWSDAINILWLVTVKHARWHHDMPWLTHPYRINCLSICLTCQAQYTRVLQQI